MSTSAPEQQTIDPAVLFSDPEKLHAHVRDHDSLVPEALRLASDSLDDIETLRIAVNNRYKQAIGDQKKEDKDAPDRTLNLSEDDPLVQMLKKTLDDLKVSNNDATKELCRQIKGTVFGPWLEAYPGLGAKSLARLLGPLGDPYLRTVIDYAKDDTERKKPLGKHYEPRTLRQLWSYAGLATDEQGQAKRRTKGMSQAESFSLGNPVLRKRAYVISETLQKNGVNKNDELIAEEKALEEAKERARAEKKPLPKTPTGPYDLERRYSSTSHGKVYLDRRAQTTERRHGAPCVRCGPSGSPAQPGSLWSNGHQHADALRMVSKQILKELWLLAREHHTGIPAE